MNVIPIQCDGSPPEWIMLEFQGDIECQKTGLSSQETKIGTIKAANAVSWCICFFNPKVHSVHLQNYCALQKLEFCLQWIFYCRTLSHWLSWLLWFRMAGSNCKAEIQSRPYQVDFYVLTQGSESLEMVIGYHQLEGQLITLKKPLAMLEKQQASQDHSIQGESDSAVAYKVLCWLKSDRQWKWKHQDADRYQVEDDYIAKALACKSDKSTASDAACLAKTF